FCINYHPHNQRLHSFPTRRSSDLYDPRYDNITDVADGGREKTNNVLDDFPQIAGLLPYNDETAHGSIEALRDRGQSSRTLFVFSDRKSTRLNSSHEWISYAVFCLK